MGDDEKVIITHVQEFWNGVLHIAVQDQEPFSISWTWVIGAEHRARLLRCFEVSELAQLVNCSAWARFDLAGEIENLRAEKVAADWVIPSRSN